VSVGLGSRWRPAPAARWAGSISSHGTHRGLCPARRSANRGAGVQHRVHRLAVLPAVRLAGLLRGAAGLARRRPLAAGSRGGGHLHQPPVCEGHPDPAHRLGHPRGNGAGHRLHAAAWARPRRGAHRGRHQRFGADPLDASVAVRLRPHCAVGTQPRRSGGGRGRARHRAAPDPGTDRRSGVLDRLRVRGARRRSGAVRDDLACQPRASPETDRRRECATRHAHLLDAMVRAGQPGVRKVQGGDQTVAADPESVDLPADRRDRRRVDHLPARADRWPTELGLPILLAPRLQLHPASPAGRRICPGSQSVAGVAAPRGRRRPGAAANHVQPGRHPKAPGIRTAMAGRLRKLPPRPGRQRRLRPTPTRRLGRNLGRPGRWPATPKSPPTTTPGTYRSP